MPEKQTFAQYLINKSLPAGIRLTTPMDGKELKRILVAVHEKYPDQYGTVVMKLKRLGDEFSTLEGITMGMDEISVPNKSKRDALLKKYKALHDNAKTDAERAKYQSQLQEAIIANDVDGMTDDASLMVVSGGLGGKRNQLVKLRSTPVVVSDYKGDVVPEIFTKSYAEGQPVLHHWLQSAESRKNLVEGQLSTAAPGEMNKVIANLMNESVVSSDDCGTRHGIRLFAKDDDALDRYLAAKAGKHSRNTLVTSAVQQDLLRSGVEKILVRSPQTCEAKDHSVCAKCMGLAVGTGKPYEIGANAGMVSAGALSEPLTQLTLSAKHSTTMAGQKSIELVGEKGFRALTTMPKEYPNRKILCELYGEIFAVKNAPQGGKYVVIRQTRPVPDRYIVHALKYDQKGYWQYYIPPQRRLDKAITRGAEVFPGMALTDGNDNLQDIARLQNLGVARSAAAEGMRNIYKRTGQTLDRRHFELLARNMMTHVKIEKAPPGFPFRRGEVVEYNALRGAMDKISATPMSLREAEGATLVEPVNQFTTGTDLTKAILDQMGRDGIKTVRATHQLEVSPVVTPMTRAMNIRTDQWVGKLNHRYLKDAIRDAASQHQKAPIHSYNPIAAYAYGAEMRQDPQGKY